MTFEETFKNWTLEQKVEWALGPNICNLSENMRSIIVDLQAENERLKRELKQTEAQDQVVVDGLRKEIAKLHCLVLHLFFTVAHEEWSVWTNILYDPESTSKDKERARRNRSRWGRILNKTFPAYRKAKAELKEKK